jgi:hypothetical protein
LTRFSARARGARTLSSLIAIHSFQSMVFDTDSPASRGDSEEGPGHSPSRLDVSTCRALQALATEQDLGRRGTPLHDGMLQALRVAAGPARRPRHAPPTFRQADRFLAEQSASHASASQWLAPAKNHTGQWAEERSRVGWGGLGGKGGLDFARWVGPRRSGEACQAPLP